MLKRHANRIMSLRRFARMAYHGIHAILWAFLFLGLLAPLQVYSQTPTPPAEVEAGGYDASAVSIPQRPPNALIGESIYQENCAPCHGQAGESDGPVVPNLPAPPPHFADPATLWEKSPAEYFYITKFGRIENLMPPWSNRLNDEQIWDVVAYAWGLHLDQSAVSQAQSQLTEATLDRPEVLREIETTFADTNFLQWTQQELVSELQSSYESVAGQWSENELLFATDYLRTLAIIPPWGATYKAGDGVIEGTVKVIEPTEDSSNSQGEPLLISNLPITLTAYVQFEPVATFLAETDALGAFQFDALSTSSGTVYLLETSYLGVPYGSDIIEFAPEDSSPLAVELPIYTTTDDPSQLQIDRVNWVIDYAPGEVIIGQILSIGNLGQQTVIGRAIGGLGTPVTAQFTLPVGATDLQFQDGAVGDRYQQLNDTVYDTTPIIPGEVTRQLFFSYRLAIDGKEIQFEQAFEYPIRTMNFLVAELPDLTVDVPDLEFVGTESIQEIPYRYWQGGDFAPRSFAVSLAGLIAADEADPRVAEAPSENLLGTESDSTGGAPLGTVATSPVMDPVMPIMVGGAILLLIVGVTAWPLSRLIQSGSNIVKLEEEKQNLIREIARLDDAHETGKLTQVAWQAERTRYKTQLISIAAELQEKA